MEAYGRLVGPPVFKTGERQSLSLAGSIPVRLRHRSDQGVRARSPVDFIVAVGDRG